MDAPDYDVSEASDAYNCQETCCWVGGNHCARCLPYVLKIWDDNLSLETSGEKHPRKPGKTDSAAALL